MVLDHYKIPNAPFTVIAGGCFTVPSHTTLLQNYPLFIKPAAEGSSKGIEGFNKVDTAAELDLAIQKVKAKFPGQDILVESFLSGREFTISILGTGSYGRVIGIREHIWRLSPGGSKNSDDYEAKQDFSSWQSKSSNGCLLHCEDSHDMGDPHVRAACQLALDTWSVLGCRDAGRVDIRFNSDGADSVPNVLEVSGAI
jgi:D-alanine-D-alanine ligase